MPVIISRTVGTVSLVLTILPLLFTGAVFASGTPTAGISVTDVHSIRIGIYRRDSFPVYLILLPKYCVKGDT